MVGAAIFTLFVCVASLVLAIVAASTHNWFAFSGYISLFVFSGVILLGIAAS